jgi:hypothetical protein
MTTVTLTNEQINTALRTPGAALGAGQFSFSVPTLASVWAAYARGSEPFSNYGVLSAAQAGHFRSALALWDELIVPNFAEITETPTSVGEIRLAFTTAPFGTGFAYSGPPQPAGGKPGDIWIDHRQASEDFAPGLANGLYETVLHEIGHTLGLKHPFEAPVIPAPFDNQRFTVMSYNGPGNAISFSGSANTIRSFIAEAATVTPMVLDIAAVQAIYGSNTTTRAGNTVYRFIQDAAVVQAIYDSGGIDTFDLSNFTRSNIIDLRPGAYSSLGQFSRADQISFWAARFPNFEAFITSVINSEADLFTFTDNVGIALNVTIENALGGIADDEIIGNATANSLTGNGGDDRLTGGGGTDMLLGGAGFDTAIFSGGRRDYQVTRSGETVTIRDLRANSDGTDTLTGIEQVQFTDGLMGLIPEELVLFLPGTRDLITWDSTQGSSGFSYFFRLGASSTVAAVADFTGDGRSDVLLSQPGGGLIRWDPTLGGNGFAVLPATPGFEVIGEGDLAGNGATDLLLKNAAGQLRILDPAAGTLSDLFGLASGWSVKGVGNINGTGKDDVILQNSSSGAVIAFTDQGWRDLITLTPASGFKIAGIGDVTGGLADDFIFQRNDGVTIFWDTTQGGQGFRDFATIGPAWKFAGFDDLNGDGRDDVLLQNNNGLAIYWTGNTWVDLGSTLIGAELVGTGVFP